jgi:hypothetical protein
MTATATTPATLSATFRRPNAAPTSTRKINTLNAQPAPATPQLRTGPVNVPQRPQTLATWVAQGPRAVRPC